MSAITYQRPRDAKRLWLAVAVASVVIMSLLAAPARPARAQDAPTGVSVEQGYGFATLSWVDVEGANEYHIERTPLDGDEVTGPGEVVGVWLPDRYTPQGRPGGELTFADSGFVLGERYRWRVRAVVNGSEGEWSDPVDGTTQGLLGPEEFLTGFELSGGARWTTHEEEVEVLEAIADASDRVRLETIGETYEGRPLHLATVGDPAPLEPEQIAESPSVLIQCTVHGPEKAREACMILLRQLAFSDDAWVTRILSQATVLINPTGNPDGQVIDRRTNTADQDLNRDHVLLRHPEIFALAEVIRDHRPDLIIDAHELGTGPDLQWLWPRSLTVHEQLQSLNQEHMTRSHMFDAGAEAGFSNRIWPTHREDNWETLLQNTAGLKNALGQLQETPRIPGPSRPAEGASGTAANQQRRIYSHLWGLQEHLDYHHDNLAAIQDAIAAAEAAHTANEGPIFLDGATEMPVPPPANEEPTIILDPPPCGYRLSAEQYSAQDGGVLIGALAGQEWTSATVEDRLAAHGIEVDEIGAGIVQVPLAQRLRAVIPYLFDPDLDTEVRPIGTPNISMVEGERLDDRRERVIIGGVDSGVRNRVDDVSCSINDLIADEQVWPNHGSFMKHVNTVLRDLRADGLINGREGGAITSAAARSGIGD